MIFKTKLKNHGLLENNLIFSIFIISDSSSTIGYCLKLTVISLSRDTKTLKLIKRKASNKILFSN